jgi:hypothetical protein
MRFNIARDSFILATARWAEAKAGSNSFMHNLLFTVMLNFCRRTGLNRTSGECFSFLSNAQAQCNCPQKSPGASLGEGNILL